VWKKEKLDDAKKAKGRNKKSPLKKDSRNRRFLKKKVPNEE